MTEDFIKALVADHQPARMLDSRIAWAIGGTATVAGAFACHLAYGIRADLLAGAPDHLVLLRSGSLLVLGASSLAAAISMARPGVGKHLDGWLWAAAAAAIFPAVALFDFMIGRFPMAIAQAPSGLRCLLTSLFVGVTIILAMGAWLRTGAPVRLERAGWATGTAAGALGTLAYSVTCPSASADYIGLWYTLSIAGSAVIGRTLLPRLLRW